MKLKTAMECLSQVDGVHLEEARNLAVVEQTGNFGLGRAKSDLYLLVEANGVTKNDTERMLVDTIAGEYERVSGSITTRLRQALAAANRRLYEANQKALQDMKMTAGVSCAAIREGDLFLAQAGPSLAYVLHQNDLQRAPADSPWLSPERAASFPYSFALGLRPTIDPELFHSPLQPGDSLLLCSCNLAARIPQAQIKEAMSRQPVAAIIEKLSPLAGSLDFSTIALEVMGEMEEEAALQEDKGDAPEGKSMGLLGRLREEVQITIEEAVAFLAGLAAPLRRGAGEQRSGRAAVSGQPSAAGAQPVVPPMRGPELVVPRPEPVVTRPELATPRYQPPLFPVEPPAAKPPPVEAEEPGSEGDAATRRRGDTETESAIPVPQSAIRNPQLAGLWQQAQTGLTAALAALRRPAPVEKPKKEEVAAVPVQPVAAAAPIPRAAPAGESLVGVPWRPRPAAPNGEAAGGSGLMARLRQRGGSGGGGQSKIKGWQIAALAGAALVILIAGGVLFSRYQQEQEANRRFATLITLAQETKGRVTPAMDRLSARALLGQAEQAVLQALDMRPDDPEAKALYANIQTTLDTVNAVVRLSNVTTLAEVPETQASLGRLIINDINVFFLDVGQDRVYKYQLSAPGASTLRTLDVNPVLLRKGDEVSNIVVRELVDILWMPGGGLRKVEFFLTLEGGGNLVEYDPLATPGLRALTVRDSASWRKPKAAAGYSGNFYVIDTQQSRILKYEPSAKGYDTPPTDWLKAPTDLTNVVDMAIDGDIYLLGLDGRIQRFRGGQSLPFPLVDLDKSMSNPASIFATPESKAVYVVDPGNKRIVQLGKEGGFQRQFRYGGPDGGTDAGKDGLFDALRSVYVDEARGRMYITSGKKLLVADIPK